MIKLQFAKFIVVGVFSTIVNYGLFYVFLHLFHLNYLLASSLGFMSGVFSGYLLNKRWTFQVQSKSHSHLYKYFFVYICSLIISISFLKIVVSFWGMTPEIANVLAIFVTTCTNFAGTKWIVFNEKYIGWTKAK